MHGPDVIFLGGPSSHVTSPSFNDFVQRLCSKNFRQIEIRPREGPYSNMHLLNLKASWSRRVVSITPTSGVQNCDRALERMIQEAFSFIELRKHDCLLQLIPDPSVIIKTAFDAITTEHAHPLSEIRIVRRSWRWFLQYTDFKAKRRIYRIWCP